MRGPRCSRVKARAEVNGLGIDRRDSGSTPVYIGSGDEKDPVVDRPAQRMSVSGWGGENMAGFEVERDCTNTRSARSGRWSGGRRPWGEVQVAYVVLSPRRRRRRRSNRNTAGRLAS